MSKLIQTIPDLIGEDISAVCFVCDYVEFHFNGATLRSLSNPMILIDGETFHFPERGSRDALCKVIGSRVRTLNLTENRSLILITTSGCEVTIPLNFASLRGPEAMNFLPSVGGPVQVW